MQSDITAELHALDSDRTKELLTPGPVAAPKQASGGTSNGSGKIPALIGIIATMVANIAVIFTHVDELREFVLRLLGTEWVYRFHTFIIYTSCGLLLLGYGGLTYWIYKNFVIHRRRWIKGGFYVAAFTVIGLIVIGSYQFLLRPMAVAPLVESETIDYAKIVLSQQVINGNDSGGFRFSRRGASNDVQVWTTAQCLMALLEQDVTTVKADADNIRTGFALIDRLRLRPPADGWGYMGNSKWGVTEIDAWVALSYMNSLRADNSQILWNANDTPAIAAKIDSIIDILMKRQHDDGGWAPIEKTSNSEHERTYSTIMAVWALAEAMQNAEILKDHEQAYRSALTRGAKWLLGKYTRGAQGVTGWWPNPSIEAPRGVYPALEALTLYVLSEAKRSQPFIGAEPNYQKSINAFISFAFDGKGDFNALIERPIDYNEQVDGSNVFLEGRDEQQIQPITLLWYPWTIAAATALEHDPALGEYQHARFATLLTKLLERGTKVNDFVENYEWTYPIAETLFAEGYYLSRDDIPIKQK